MTENGKTETFFVLPSITIKSTRSLKYPIITAELPSVDHRNTVRRFPPSGHFAKPLFGKGIVPEARISIHARQKPALLFIHISWHVTVPALPGLASCWIPTQGTSCG